jgi:hypothetical protein
MRCSIYSYCPVKKEIVCMVLNFLKFGSAAWETVDDCPHEVSDIALISRV